MSFLLFALKKFISLFCYPLGLGLLLGFSGLIISRGKKVGRMGLVLVAVGLMQLYLFSIPIVGSALINNLEAGFQPVVDTRILNEKGIEYIVVLGGGAFSQESSSVDALSENSLRRLLEGIRLYRALPGAKLVFCGGAFNADVPESQRFAEMAIELGIPPEAIIQENQSWDTEDQAVLLDKMFKGKPFALTTSAWHMKRSLYSMESRGLKPLPAPADFRGRRISNSLLKIFPSLGGLELSTLAIHEHLGILWFKIRNWI